VSPSEHELSQLAELMRGAGLVVNQQVHLTFGVCVASLGIRAL
jgi:hypothetical protein